MVSMQAVGGDAQYRLTKREATVSIFQVGSPRGRITNQSGVKTPSESKSGRIRLRRFQSCKQRGLKPEDLA